MKTVFALVCVFSILTACQTGHPIQQNVSDTSPFQRYRSLADALKIYGAVQVSGTGVQQKVTMRRNGVAASEPLYVLDGLPLGSNYRSANHAVNMAQVKQIKVMSNLHELVRYGAQSYGGVILIKTTESPRVKSHPDRGNQVVIGSKQQ